MEPNSYAELLKKQGYYVINVAGVDWYDYNGFMIPAYLPHCFPVITQDMAVEVLRKSGRPFVRWSTQFGVPKNNEWWFVLKKGPWEIESVTDKKKRWMIRQGKKNFKVRHLTPEEVATKCPKVAQLAAARYKGEAEVESEEMLAKCASAAREVPGVLEYMGCFYNDELVAFSENHIQDNAVWLAVIRYDPAYLGKYSSYGFLDGILDYYLNEKKMLYVLDGCRNIYHRTAIQEHLIRVFGFTKEYACLNLAYRPWFAMGVKAAYAFKGPILNLSDKWVNGILDKVGGILKQEHIRRACEGQAYPSDRLQVAVKGGGITAGSADKHSAFVTYGWCRTTYAVVMSLGRRGIDVHVSDASLTAMSRYSRYCKSYVKVPDFFVEPERYFEATCEALKKTGARVLLPSHEDVGIFCRRKNELPSGVRVALPDWNSYRIAEDKLAVLDVAAQAGCPTPLTTKVESWSQLESLSKSADWPVVLKTRIGNSAKGVRIARNREELFAKYKDLVETFHLPPERRPFLQEFLSGEAAGVCVLYQNGRCVTSFAERYLRCKEPGKFGTSTLREPFENPQLISRAISVMDRLKWHGVAHIDFVADKTGDFRLIEVNPRLWGALALSMFSGVDFPYLWYLTATGESVNESVVSKYPLIKCRWIAGDCLAFLERLKRGMFAEALQILVPQRRCYHDDFVLTDPLPFIFEVADYAVKFVKGGGSVNPVTSGMVR